MPEISYPPPQPEVRCTVCRRRADGLEPFIVNEYDAVECWTCACGRHFVCRGCGNAQLVAGGGPGSPRGYCRTCYAGTYSPPVATTPIDPWGPVRIEGRSVRIEGRPSYQFARVESPPTPSWTDFIEDEDEDDSGADDGYDDDDGYGSDNDDGSHYRCGCGSCSDSYGRRRGDGYINSYSYKPYPEFHGEGPVFLGAELEVEVDRYKGRDDAAAVATRHLGGLGYLKEDGSINYGFEIVTHPMSHAWAAESFPWEMLDELKSHGCKTTSRVGMHVHVSRAGFTDPVHAYRWLKMLYRNSHHVTAVARRTSDEWAAWRSTERHHVKDYVKGHQDGAARYSAVNVLNPETFEIRVFRSTLNPVKFRAALDLIDGSVEYTRALTVGDISQRDGWTWPAFRKWVSDRPEYSALLSQMGR